MYGCLITSRRYVDTIVINGVEWGQALGHPQCVAGAPVDPFALVKEGLRKVEIKLGLGLPIWQLTIGRPREESWNGLPLEV
jgi:hypothetical protein